MDQPIDHNELEESLKRCGASWNAGQAHGLLCSRLTVAGGDGAVSWLAQVLAETEADNALRRECETMLDAVCATTWRQLVERQSEFILLLPDDEDAAELRAEAMGHWCEGYLHGLVTEKHSEALRKRLGEEPLADIIKDMLEITRATVDEEGGTDDNEEAYAELVEYLRVAVQLAYEELAEFREPAEEQSGGPSDTIH